MTYELNTETSAFNFDKMQKGLPVVVLASIWQGLETWPYRFSFEYEGWLYGHAYCQRVNTWVSMTHTKDGIEKHFGNGKRLMMDESQETVHHR